MEHELQANKLHIQSLMQQLHAIAAKQALGGSEAAADEAAAAAAAAAATGAQEAGPSAAGIDQQQNSSSAHAAAEDATHDVAAAASSPAGSCGSCCSSSSGGSAFTPVRSFNCQGVTSPSSSSEATSKCRPACSSFTRGGCLFHCTADMASAAQPVNTRNVRPVCCTVPQM
jgi:hypothetical protein